MADAKPNLMLAMMSPKLGSKSSPPRPDKGSFRGSPFIRDAKDMGKGTGDEDGDEDSSEPDPDLEHAAEDVMHALETSDAKSFAESMRAFVSMC